MPSTLEAPTAGKSVSRLRTPEESSGERVHDAIAKYRDLYKNPLFSRVTQLEYEQMLEDPNVRGNIKAIQENIQWMQMTIKQANRYRDRFTFELRTAVSNKWISEKSKERWMQRFNDPSVLEWDRKDWLNHKFPKYVANWKKLRTNQDKIEEKAKRLGVNFAEIDGLQDLANPDQFLDEEYAERQNILQKAESYLAAVPNGMKQGWKSVQSLLTGFTVGTDACLHASKIGTWMKRMFLSCDTPEDIKEYLDEVLMPLVANWKDASSKYEELKKEGYPMNFKSVSKQEFLKWHYDKRMSYLEELQRSQKAMKGAGAEDLAELEQQKLGIRYDLSSEDFEGAEEKLLKLMDEYPLDSDLQSMDKYLRARRQKKNTEGKDGTDPEAKKKKLKAELSTYVGRIDPAMKQWYIEAMEKGPKVFRRWKQVNDNHPWVRQHGYSDADAEVQHAKDDNNHEKTEQYVENGHSKKLERNVLRGKTVKKEAIRDKCTKAQLLYLDTKDCRPVLEKVIDNKDNEMFGYWTTIVFNDVPYEKRLEATETIHRPILSRLRQLEELGDTYKFEEAYAEEKVQLSNQYDEKYGKAETTYATPA